MRDKRGFTMVELVIVSAAMAFIALAIYSTFSSGIKIWQRIEKDKTEEDVNIFFEKFDADLRSAIPYKTIVFSGEPYTFELPALLSSPRMGLKTVSKIEYSYNSDSNTVKRDVTDISGIFEDDDPTVSREVLRDVSSLKFQYYVYDRGLKQYVWQDEWSTDIPVAIKVELEMERGYKVIKFAKTSGIPLGN